MNHYQLYSLILCVFAQAMAMEHSEGQRASTSACTTMQTPQFRDMPITLRATYLAHRAQLTQQRINNLWRDMYQSVHASPAEILQITSTFHLIKNDLGRVQIDKARHKVAWLAAIIPPHLAAVPAKLGRILADIVDESNDDE